MNKKLLIEKFTTQIASELHGMKIAAQSTYDEATHEDSKAENKYDTRGLEASYLAGAQAKRVSDLQELLAIFENLPIKTFSADQKISMTALIEVLQNEKKNFLLLMPKGGGQSLNFEGQTVQVITAESPLGSLLMGKEVGDEIELELGSRKVIYEIISIL